MTFLPRPALLFLLLAAAVPISPQAQDTGWETTTPAPTTDGWESSYVKESISIKDTMNFVDCVKPKRSYCAAPPGACIIPGPGKKVAYREPTVVVEVTCRFGESPLLNSDPAGKAMGKALQGAVQAATGPMKCMVQQSSEPGKNNQSNYFFHAHAFGITPGAMAAAVAGNGKKAKAAADIFACETFVALRKLTGNWSAMLDNAMNNLTQNLTAGSFTPSPAMLTGADDVIGLVSAAGRWCGPDILTANLTAQFLPIGLIPAFISELCVTPPWTVMNPKNIKDPICIAANKASIETSGIACMAASAYNSVLDGTADFAGLDLDALTLDLGDNMPCVGWWGTRCPTTGYHSAKVRPVSGAMIAYRAYQEAANAVPKYKNRKGTLKFNMDYPFINNGMIPSINPFSRPHGHKGSGCYNVGTMNPSWYTAGETLIADPSAILGNLLNDIKGTATTGKATKTDNGDYVFTFWKNNTCCYGVCLKPVLQPFAKKEFN